MAENDCVVFVYGTLRRGLANHRYLAQAGFLGPGRTVERYCLFQGLYPYLCREPARVRVAGEAYAVQPEILAALDELEGHPEEYRREKAEVELEGGRVVTAWVYFHPRPEGREVASGDVLLG